METYAEVADLEAEWRPLTAPEKARAGKLLEMAGILIRRRVAVDDEETRAVSRWVSLDMVFNALAVPMEQRGKTQWATTVGAVSESASMLNPQVTLQLLAGHLELLGLPAMPGASYAFGWRGEEPLSEYEPRYRW